MGMEIHQQKEQAEIVFVLDASDTHWFGFMETGCGKIKTIHGALYADMRD